MSHWNRIFTGMVAGIVSALSIPSSATVILIDRPDIKVRDSITNVEAVGRECAVTVHPDDWKILLMSVISSTDNSCSEWVSTDGGISWKGDAVGDSSLLDSVGDPSVAILKGSPARYLVQGISKDIGQHVAYTDSPTGLFTQQSVIIPGSEQSTDKGWLLADNYSANRNLYSLWYHQGAGLWFRYSVNRGVSWIPLQPVPLRSDGVCWGGTLCVGIATSVLGHVYAAWPNYNTFSDPPINITFKRSTSIPTFLPVGNGTVVTTYPGGSFDPHSDLPNSDNTNANSIPSMAADDEGNIYIAWCEKRVGHGDAHVYVAKSTDNGSTWPSSPVEVTSSSDNQWLPWIAWDNDAKALVAMFHDSRSNANTAEVYLAVSYDRGATFAELKVGDVPWSGNSDVGEYHGVAAGGGIAYPMWCDDRETTVKTFTSPTLIAGIESTSIVPTVTHHCAGTYTPRFNFKVDWTTLVNMDGTDKLTLTRPGGTQYIATANSTSNTHQLTISGLNCVNGTWTYQVESNKGAGVSRSAAINVVISCLTCPPCPPPCELD